MLLFLLLLLSVNSSGGRIQEFITKTQGKKSVSIEVNNQQGPNYLLLAFILQKRQGIILR